MKASRFVQGRRRAWLIALTGVFALGPVKVADASITARQRLKQTRERDPSTTATTPATPARDLELVLIRPGPVDFDALRDALSVRAPGRAIHRFGDPDAPSLRDDDDDDARRGLFVDIEEVAEVADATDDPAPAAPAELEADAPEAMTTLRLTMIQSDGRAYLRELETPISDARAVALVLANTMAAIEEEAIAPDREQVTLPEPALAPEYDMSIKTPEEERDAIVEPPPPAPSAANSSSQSAERPPPRLELGLDLSPSFAAVLGPGRIQGLSGGGGELRLTTRFPVGASAALGLRLLTRGVDNSRALRARVTLGGGYVLRLGEVEFAALAGFTIEPWTLLGEQTPIGELDSRALLLGGLASASVGYRLSPRARPNLRMRVGGRLELSGSTLLSGQAVELVDAQSEALLFGLGGFELLLGLDVALWFDVPSRAR